MWVCIFHADFIVCLRRHPCTDYPGERDCLVFGLRAEISPVSSTSAIYSGRSEGRCRFMIGNSIFLKRPGPCSCYRCRQVPSIFIIRSRASPDTCEPRTSPSDFPRFVANFHSAHYLASFFPSFPREGSDRTFVNSPVVAIPADVIRRDNRAQINASAGFHERVASRLSKSRKAAAIGARTVSFFRR